MLTRSLPGWAFFTRSDLFSGTAIVTQDGAYLWTDGRYHNQALKQMDKNEWTLMKEGIEGTPKR